MALVTCPTSSSSEPCIPASVHSLQELFPLSVPCFSISLWHPGSGSVSFCSVLVAEGTEGSLSCLWPCEQNCAILWDIFTLLGEGGGGVECWRLARWKSAGIAVQWTKLRGKLEVAQNSVRIQLHTLKIGGGGKSVWLCPEALTVYIVQWENQKTSLQVVEPCDLANVCVWNPVYSAFQILTL